ncbi:MAG TPA: LamG domain-containing protein, partial [Candidatus Saccharimonadales bacterium]|nr:LamG domain-containing protein [Candidatus Saccharimonadales bacterium]
MAGAATPPVVRSTAYTGAYSNIVRYAPQPWMNTNGVQLTAEAWVYCNDVSGFQTFVARHYSTNLWFGLNGNRLRFYRSGGLLTDSDGTLVARRWTHVAVTYDGSTARFFINGTNAGIKTLANAGSNCTNSLSLGGQADILSAGDTAANGYAFDGFLDEVRLWAVVRSATAVVSGMTNEIRSGTGLLATFGSGGDQNDIRAENGTTTGTPVLDRESGFGIHPRTLCIPHTPNGLVVNGVIDMLNEYRGAETIVLRSTNLFSNLPDQPAYLMVSSNSTNNHLYIAVPNLPQAGSPQIPYVHVMCDVDPIKVNAPDIGDWQCTFTQDSFQGGYRYDVNPPFFPTPKWLSWGQSISNWQGATASPFEFLQNYEFRIHAKNLNYFTNSVGLLVQYAGYSSGGDYQSAPISGTTNQSTTYAQANWCGSADSSLRPVSLSGIVSNVTTMAGEFGWTVTLSAGADPLSATQIRTVFVNGNGTFLISGNVPEELPFYVTLDFRTGYTYLPPEFFGAGILPSSISGNKILTFPPCTNSSCTAKFTRFQVQSPPGPVSVSGMTPNSGSPELVLRASPLKVIPATIVTLTGSNLHTSFEVSLSKCLSIPPSFCTEGVDIFRCTILSNDFARNTLTVQLPGEDPQFVGSMQWVLKDLDPGHPGWTQWVYGPSGFVVNRTHPYPVLNGFEFIN